MKKAILGLTTVVVVLAATLVFRAGSQFHDQQLAPAPGIAEINLDKQAAVQNFSQALTIPTVSYDDRSQFDASAFIAFRAFLANAYPLVHENADVTVESDYSLVYHLPGSDPSLR